MIRLSINLPIKYRLDLHLVKRRMATADPLLPDLKSLMRIRSGNKVSRFFRHIFEHKNIKKIVGTNLSLLVLATFIVPSEGVVPEEEAEINTTPTPIVLTTENAVQYPVHEVKITQGYKFYHTAIDLDGERGDLIYPVMSGVVDAVNYSWYGYGDAIIIDHGSNITSLYAHMSVIYIKKDDVVTKNTILGEMGATGWASGDHLHLEVRDNGKPINPLAILP